jgi:hypothetical protein
MLLNEFLKEHRKVEQQQATIGRLKISYFAAVGSPLLWIRYMCSASLACKCCMYLSG